MGGDFLVAIEVIDSGTMVGACSFIGTLLVMAGVERNPGPANKTFVFRYQYLLIEGGSVMLRQIFDHIVGPDFKVYLDINPSQKAKFQHLVSRNILTPSQLQLLPPIDNSPSSDNFDITLLCCLLRNVCGLCSSSDPVLSNPQPTDTRVEAHIARLKTARNNLAHSGSVFDDMTDLNTKWSDLRLILQGLSNHCGYRGLNALLHTAETIEIDESLKASFDKSLKEWRHEIGEVRTEVDDVKSEVDDVRAEVDDVRAEVDNVRAEVDDVRSEILKVKSDVYKIINSLIKYITSILSGGEASNFWSWHESLYGDYAEYKFFKWLISRSTEIFGEEKDNPWLGIFRRPYVSKWSNTSFTWITGAKTNLSGDPYSPLSPIVQDVAHDNVKQYVADSKELYQIDVRKLMNELRTELYGVSYFLYRFYLASRLSMLSKQIQYNIPHRQPLNNKNLLITVT